ncbi:hypothetical protein [Microbacterium murale]|uniref:Uncharacterized protein n=1 Tax=Microbacterium murale TaxID=1081040 RepID=A0ABU0PG76_9MICO|nr:hypothetical protein [Microbacterium murale]MDQ0645656.1 hypothetical protein [Microbacterium murale]
MTDSTADRFASAVERFESSAPWLGDPHAPALVTLHVLAETLDAGDLTPALVAQFGLTFRSLAKLAPTANAAEDPLEKALRDAGAT